MKALIGRMLRPCVRMLLALAACVALAACSTSGHSFATGDLVLLQAGRTTLEQASRILQAEPVNVYYRGDGSALAIWEHKASLVTDAVYFRRELWLAFGPDGTFRKIVDRTNVPAWSWSEPADAGGPDGPSAARPPARAGAGGPSVPRATHAQYSPSDTSLYEPAVSYSLSP